MEAAIKTYIAETEAERIKRLTLVLENIAVIALGYAENPNAREETKTEALKTIGALALKSCRPILPPVDGATEPGSDGAFKGIA